MRKIIVLSMITLDGVMQAPGGPEEDPSGGFKYGGWTAPYGDEAYRKVLQEELKPAEYLLGRKTFGIWEPYWPEHADFWPGINEGTKYVMSGSRDKSDWKNSVFIRNLTDIKNDLVDELRLKIHPLILGKGKKLFGEGVIPASFILTESCITPGGVIIACYKRSGEVRTGTAGA